MDKMTDTSIELVKLIKKNKIVMMVELKNYLETPSRMTVFRKLKQLDYISSYSHQGKYYSLDRIAQYDNHGIWRYQSISFRFPDKQR